MGPTSPITTATDAVLQRVLVLAAGLLLAGCAQEQGGCAASASGQWPAVAAISAEAHSRGPNCEAAEVTLTLRGQGGAVLWTHSAAARQVMTFLDVRTKEQMGKALGSWLEQNPAFANTEHLPEWRAGEAQPMNGEFPFYPDESVDRTFYETLRGQRLPMFCYVQGMESLACVVLKDGQMTKAGVQSFPG